MLTDGDAHGLLFGIIKADGCIEMGFSGSLFDNSLITSGLTSKLRSLVDSWHEHPSIYLPEAD